MWSCKELKRIPFSRQSIVVLEDWFDTHQDNPYASPDTKRLLATQTKLSIRQVSIWLTNERKKLKKSKTDRRLEPLTTRNRGILQKYFQQTNGSPSNEQIKEIVNKTALLEQRINLVHKHFFFHNCLIKNWF